MFWKIFFDSLILILGVLAVGWVVASIVRRRKRSQQDRH
jgi:hypothetical protein